MANIEKIKSYIRTVVDQAHQSETKSAERFYLQAWLLNGTDLVVFATSPYIRVIRKIYYRLNRNMYKNFGIRMVDVSSLIYHAGPAEQADCPRSAISLQTCAYLGMCVGELRVEAINLHCFINVALRRDYQEAGYLDEFIPPQLRVDNDIERCDMQQELDDKALKAVPGARVYMYPCDFEDPVGTSIEAYAKVTGYTQPRMCIQEVLSIVPENQRPIKP